MRYVSPSEIERALPMPRLIAALDEAFAASARQPVPSAVAGIAARGGKFHVKAAIGPDPQPLFAAKINANFPGNPERGLPTIQGIVALFDATDGRVLGTMDSAMLTAIRTAAASGVAAKHLAPAKAESVALIGCGAQAFHHTEAFRAIRPVRRVSVFDTNTQRAQTLAARVRGDLSIDCDVADSVEAATRGAQIVATLTSSRQPFLGPDKVMAGAFVAAVGVDSPDKSEIHPALMRETLVVADDIEQCAVMGDLHHAIAAGVMGPGDVWGNLASVCANPGAFRVPVGRTVIFDSTGIPLEDVVAARLVVGQGTE